MLQKGEAIKDFLTLRKLAEQQKDWNAKSIAGNALIDWGTEKARRKNCIEINHYR